MSNAETTRFATKDPGAILQAKRIVLPQFGLEVGPLGHLAGERARLSQLTWERFDVKPLAATIGAEISGVDLAGNLDDGTIGEIRRAMIEYKVIFFRDQPLSSAQHVAFARRFGALEIHPFIPPNPVHPELVRFEKSADVGGYENGWHSDVTWRECPSMGAILHAIQVPATGGDTLFADMIALYDGLDESTREVVDDLVAVHDYSRVFGHQVDDAGRDEMRAKYPPVAHPVIRTHPESGRRLMYLNRFFVDHIVGLSPEDSLALVNRLCSRADLPEYQVRFHWEKDSLAFWDNRAVQHYAASDYWPDVRIMERASIIGDRPT
jgi:alpha-ketoglutarate-dependent taurine dioxygenase